MSTTAMRLLLVEDNPGDARLFREMCREPGSLTLELTHVGDLRGAEAHLADHAPDLILLDLGLPDAQGIDAVQRAHAAAPRVPLVVLTGLDDESVAVQALQEGAQDYLIKGQLETRGLMRTLRYAIERKVMEEALFEEKERAQVTLNSIGDAVTCTDVAGNITFLNLVAETLTGWSLLEGTGRPMAEVLRFVDATTRETTPDPMELAIRQDHTAHLGSDCLLIRRDGFEIPIDDAVSPIHDHDGHVTGAVIVFRDVSAARAIALQMRAVDAELERSNRELEDFATIASHDLQEPLRKIQAFGDRLAERSSGGLDEESEDYLRRMMNAADRMQSLITALLEYSRVTIRPEPSRPVDLGQVVSDVLSDLEERIRESHGSVLVGPLPTVSASPLQMRELFQNLIANALKFHAYGAAPEVHVEATARGDSRAVKGRHGHTPVWEISVSDNGIGFEEQYAERIFAPFQRLNGRQAFEGTGMGLAICRRIVALRGGTISATSQPGAGATFMVTLPRTALAAKAVGPGA
ncbi:MAG: ATP-binding protein [Candidatus Limnocylindrales bacterium]|jgi:PAS domain S-box-containing protein